jgi:hypothetical protein
VSALAVSAGHLRRLATVDRSSLFRDADTLVLSTEGITRVPLAAVVAALEGRSSFVLRVLYTRGQFADDGIVPGKAPRAIGPVSLDERLEDIAAFLTGTLADETSGAPDAAIAAPG